MRARNSAGFIGLLFVSLICAACSSGGGSHAVPPVPDARRTVASLPLVGALVVAVSCGAASGTDYFSADKYWVGYSGGGKDSSPIDVSNPNAAPAGVYANYRTAPNTLTYNVTGLVPDAPYTGFLHFEEPLQALPGRRVESVSVAGVMVAPSLDIFAAAGGQHKALAVPFTANADANGTLQILLRTLVNASIISGFEIYSVASPAPSPSPSSNPGLAGIPVYAINAGGQAVGYFGTDNYVGYSGAGSDNATIDVNVPNAAAAAVYADYRTTPQTLTYNVTGLEPNGPYTGFLHFEEPLLGGPGRRVQTVSVGSVTVSSALDIYAATGGQHKALVLPFHANADAGGTLRILLTALVNNTIISGFEIYSASATPSPNPTAMSFQAPLPGQFGITAFGGLKGLTYTPHVSGDTFDYAEVLAIDFNDSVNLASFNAGVTLTPAAPWAAYPTNYGKRIQLTVRMTPGTVYTLTLNAGLSATNGNAMPAAQSFRFTTPANVIVPARSRATAGEPYRYGVLAHPYSSSLAGANATAIADILAGEGAGFVRIDYTGSQVMPTPTTLDFVASDKIVSLLSSRGITLMPILEQYNAAGWQNGFQAYPAIYTTPQLYAGFVSAVVGHLRTVAPQVTRIELFNEPNLNGWWTNVNARYAATDGSAAAAYMLAGYHAAKAANPSIVVVGPALANGGTGVVDPRSFLSTMYANGCRSGTCWDVLSVHPYAWTDPTYVMPSSTSNRWQVYRDLQAIAVANGDPTPHVMLTEWGFSTANQSDGFDPAVQARFMAIGFNLMLADPTVDGIVWTGLNPAGTDFWSLVALTDASLHPLPAAATFQSFARP